MEKWLKLLFEKTSTPGTKLIAEFHLSFQEHVFIHSINIYLVLTTCQAQFWPGWKSSEQNNVPTHMKIIIYQREIDNK